MESSVAVQASLMEQQRERQQWEYANAEKKRKIEEDWLKLDTERLALDRQHAEADLERSALERKTAELQLLQQALAVVETAEQKAAIHDKINKLLGL